MSKHLIEKIKPSSPPLTKHNLKHLVTCSVQMCLNSYINLNVITRIMVLNRKCYFIAAT